MPLISDRISNFPQAPTANSSTVGSNDAPPPAPGQVSASPAIVSPIRGTFPTDEISDVVSDGLFTLGRGGIPQQRFARIEQLEDRFVLRQQQSNPAQVAAAPAAAADGTPQQVSNVSATESPVRSQSGQMNSRVSVNFDVNPSDEFFSRADIYFIGYRGSSTPTLVAGGPTSPVTFDCDTTGETVTVIVVAVGSTGLEADITFAPTATVVLDGVVSAPPNPTIAQSLVQTPVGYQFSFDQLSGLAADQIAGYRVWQNTTNNSGTASQIDFIAHNPTNSTPVVVQQTVPNGITYFYWVSSVNTTGLESAKVAAQSGSIISGTTVVSDNLVKNGDFDQGNFNWSTGTGITFLSGQANLPRGTCELKLTGQTGNIVPMSQELIPIDPAKTYLFECWAKIGTPLTGITLRPLLAEYDANKVALPFHISGGASFMYQQILSSTTGNTWQYFATEITGSAASPANNFQFNSSTRYVVAGCMLTGSGTTGQIGEVTGIRFSEVAAGNRRAISAIDSTNVVIPTGLDFTRAYLNKHLGNIPDDAGSSRFAVLAVDANRRPLIDFSQGTHLNKTLDNIGEGTQFMRLPNAPTNRNLIPDSGFKTWNSNTLYWVPSSWVQLPSQGKDGGNAIGYLGTGSPSGFPEAGLRKSAILLAPGSYTLSAYMDSTFVTSSSLDIGLYLSWYPGTPTALDGGVVHLNQTHGTSGRVFTNFTLSLKTRNNSTAYAVNDLALDSHGNLQAVTTAGTSGGTTPTWSTTLTGTTTDGTVTWTLINLATTMLGGTKIPFNILIFPSNATVTAGKYAIISNPQLEVEAPSGTPTPYQENSGDDTTGTMLVDLSNTNHGSMTVSTLLNPQGSIVPGQSFALSWSDNSSSISLSWSAASLLRADGSSLSVSSGTQNYSSLSSTTQYWFYPYINVSSGTIGFANGSPPPTSTSNTLAIQAALDGRIPLLPFSVTTAASGGSGSGSGGDGSCPDSNELVEIRRFDAVGTLIFDGNIKAADVEFGDYIKGYSFETHEDVFRRVIGKAMKSCSAWRIVQGHKVSPCEPVYLNNQWLSASRVPGAPLDTSIGIKMDLVVEADDFNQHNYWLVGGNPLLIHNPVLPRS